MKIHLLLISILILSCSSSENRSTEEILYSDVETSFDMSNKDYKKIIHQDPYMNSRDTFFSIFGKVYDLKNDSIWAIYCHKNHTEYPDRDGRIHVYQKNKGEFEMALKIDAGGSFLKDIIMDVDFDGDLDYVISSYSPVGCCPRDQKHIYINMDGRISSDIQILEYYLILLNLDTHWSMR